LRCHSPAHLLIDTGLQVGVSTSSRDKSRFNGFLILPVRSVKLPRNGGPSRKNSSLVYLDRRITGLKVLIRVKILLPGRIAENQEGLTGLERSR
jgi:hypothetical protein